MYTKDDILKRLQDGETSETIAQEMAQALNDAIAAKEEADRQAALKAEAAKRQALYESMRYNECADLADHFNGFLDKYYPELEAHVTTNDIFNIVEGVKGLMDIFAYEKDDDRTPDDIIADFIKNLDI